MMRPAATPDSAGDRAPAPPARRLRRLLLEGAAVAGLGLALALIANAVSPKGLTLGRDYFPRATEPVPVNPGAPGVMHPSPDQTAGNSVAARLRERGLGVSDFPEARRLFEDPRREQELVVFVDARNDAGYLAGHIPGAYQFDHYYPEKYLPAILPACLAAETVVVYCTGGNCEDSEFAALALMAAGVAPERVTVFVAGIEEWRHHRMPLEVGPRGSGDLQTLEP